MKESPIIFSTPMVKAILEGRKTQTRRIFKCSWRHDIEDGKAYIEMPDGTWPELISPYGKPGDLLWVRETHQHTSCLNINPEDENYGYVYRADGQPWDDYDGWKWKRSIHMPKAAARIWLQITEVKVERLENITKEDAIAEGIEIWEQQGITRYKAYGKFLTGFWDDGNHLSIGAVHPAIASFRSLWASINGYDNLNSNPWLWVISFKVLSTTGKPGTI